MIKEMMERYLEIALRTLPEAEERQVLSLSGPASEQELVDAQERLGMVFDEPLLELYRYTNGGYWLGQNWARLSGVAGITEKFRETFGLESSDGWPDWLGEAKAIDLAYGGQAERLFYVLDGPLAGQLAYSDQMTAPGDTVVPYFDSLEEYFEFHVSMAERGFIQFSDHDEINGVVVRSAMDNAAAVDWMTSHGHPPYSDFF